MNQFDDSNMFRRGWNSTTFRSLSWNMSCNTPPFGNNWTVPNQWVHDIHLPLKTHLPKLDLQNWPKILSRQVAKVWRRQDVFQRGWFCIFSTSFFMTVHGRCHGGWCLGAWSRMINLRPQDGPLPVIPGSSRYANFLRRFFFHVKSDTNFTHKRIVTPYP